MTSATASIIIPAHNEERGIARLLDALAADTSAGEFEIFVVCNGCTDNTAEIARKYAPGLQVIDLPEPSKRNALKHGDAEATVFPRLYIDSDVAIDTVSVRALVAALHEQVLATAPVRVIPRSGVSRLVRAYYDVWEQLPQVQTAPFGRGVVAVSEDGHARISKLPPVMADDFAIAAAFQATECTVVPDAYVVVWPPRTLRDLLRRRIRVNTGNAPLHQQGGRSQELKTSPRALLDVARAHPTLLPKLPVFLGVAIISRLAARGQIRRGDFDTWLRDESSREPVNWISLPHHPG